MIQAVRQRVIVAEGGQIVVRVPELKPGSGAEVIVLPDETAVPESGQNDKPLVRRSSLIGSCKGMFKSPEDADRYLNEERDSWER